MGQVNDNFLVDLLHNGDFVASSTGDLQTIKGINNLKQALNNRLITMSGSLAHRPTYGIGIQRYQGMTVTIEDQRQIALDIEDQFTQEKRIEKVTSVRVIANDNDTGISKIFVKIKPIGYNEFEQEFNIEA